MTYSLQTPSGVVILPDTLTPDTLTVTRVTHNLVRARGYAQQFDLSDGIPDPAPLTLSGVVYRASETDLSLWLAELRDAVRSATALIRADRDPVPILGASVQAVPSGRYSGAAQLTITLIPAVVDATGLYYW